MRQLKHCLRTLTEDDVLPLSKSQIVAVCSEARPSPDDGLVAYARFAPTAANVVYGMLDFEAQKRRMAAVRDLANVDTSFGVMRGMDPKEVEATLKDAFAACDLDGNGVLDEEEMRLVLDSVGVERARVDGEADPRHRRRGGRGRRRGGGLRRARVARARDGAAARDGGRDPAQGVPERAASIVGRKDILQTRDDTLGAALASASTDDVSHLKQDFDAGGRGAAGKIRNQRSVRSGSAGTSRITCRRCEYYARTARDAARADSSDVFFFSFCQTHKSPGRLRDGSRSL